MQGQGEPSIEKETSSTALVNGNNLLGPVSVATKLMCFYVVFIKQAIRGVPDKFSRYQILTTYLPKQEGGMGRE